MMVVLVSSMDFVEQVDEYVRHSIELFRNANDESELAMINCSYFTGTVSGKPNFHRLCGATVHHYFLKASIE